MYGVILQQDNNMLNSRIQSEPRIRKIFWFSYKIYFLFHHLSGGGEVQGNNYIIQTDKKIDDPKEKVKDQER